MTKRKEILGVSFMNIGNHSYRQLVEVNAVKSKIFIVDWIQCSSHHPSLDFVLFFGKQL